MVVVRFHRALPPARQNRTGRVKEAPSSRGLVRVCGCLVFLVVLGPARRLGRSITDEVACPDANGFGPHTPCLVSGPESTQPCCGGAGSSPAPSRAIGPASSSRDSVDRAVLIGRSPAGSRAISTFRAAGPRTLLIPRGGIRKADVRRHCLSTSSSRSPPSPTSSRILRKP